ncbi:disulfide bond formation protein B [Amaricoccus sp. B4]|uniref:disulfide bond formation protein B n=1 Tax=Amaricoccus sp. B4 TaxID=3368557 RepID=UPI00371F7AAD
MNELQRRGLGAAIGSAALLGAALVFQYVGGLAPCPICIWQRWPHGVAIACFALLIVLPIRFWAFVGGLAMTVNAGISLYHTGIERRWWPGPDSCTGPDVGSMSSSELLDRLLDTPAVLCDQVSWEFLGLSMASWNGICCLILAWLWFRAYASSSASQ